jgi:hypothetical protein
MEPVMAEHTYTIFVDGVAHCRCNRQELIAVLHDLDYDPPTVIRLLSRRGQSKLEDDLGKLVVTEG